MNIEKENEKKLYLLIGVFSAIVFLGIYGHRVLIPTYDDWLYSGFDLTQHYLGWRAFRQSPWHFPIGLMDGLNYPNQISIIYTDSIPLLAVLFKLISPILPKTFQYFGIWGMLSFVLMGVFSAKILYSYAKSRLSILFGVSLFLLQPVMLWKMYHHSALAGQWILVLAFYLLYFSKETKWYYPLIMGFLAANIHIYFVLMCGILLVGYVLNQWVRSRNLWWGIIFITEYIGVVAIVVGLLGGFSGGVSCEQEGLRDYAFNFLGFINPMGYEISSSCILPEIGIVAMWTDEGFAYLGLGGILLCLLAGVVLVQHRKEIKKNELSIMFGLVVSFAIALLFALSPRWGIGRYVICDISLPQSMEKLWSIFRATGRVAWILIYGLIILSLLLVLKYLPKKTGTLLLAGLMLIQIVDIHEVFLNRYEKWFQKKTYEAQMIDEDALKILANGDIKHLYYISECNSYEMYEWSKWALDHGLTTNDFYFARSNREAVKDNLNDALEEKNVTDAFVFKKKDESIIEKYSMQYIKVGDFFLGYWEE